MVPFSHCALLRTNLQPVFGIALVVIVTLIECKPAHKQVPLWPGCIWYRGRVGEYLLLQQPLGQNVVAATWLYSFNFFVVMWRTGVAHSRNAALDACTAPAAAQHVSTRVQTERLAKAHLGSPLDSPVCSTLGSAPCSLSILPQGHPWHANNGS